MDTFYSCDYYKFAKQVVWYGCEEQRGEKYPFLAFLMGRGSRSAYEHAREAFGFTDEDFREALRQAKPGTFIYPERWEEWNIELGINPPLPFPRKDRKFYGAMLDVLMAHGEYADYEYVRQLFGFTDEDFREALRKAKPGVFEDFESWSQWNKEFGIDPPLPFP